MWKSLPVALAMGAAFGGASYYVSVESSKRAKTLGEIDAGLLTEDLAAPLAVGGGVLFATLFHVAARRWL